MGVRDAISSGHRRSRSTREIIVLTNPYRIRDYFYYEYLVLLFLVVG